MLNTVGIIGDIHAEDKRLEACLAYLTPLGLDALLCVGDVVDGQGDAERCCELVRANNVVCVRGNRDRWILSDQMRALPDATNPRALSAQSMADLGRLPSTRTFDSPTGRILLCHGLGANDMRRLTPDDYGYALESNTELQELLTSQRYAFVINGHSHKVMIRKFNALTIINAGTLHRDFDPGFLTADFTKREVKSYLIGADVTISAGEAWPLP